MVIKQPKRSAHAPPLLVSFRHDPTVLLLDVTLNAYVRSKKTGKIFLRNENVLTSTSAPGASYTYTQGHGIELKAAEGVLNGKYRANGCKNQYFRTRLNITNNTFYDS
jgi:hypothetical protein